MVNQWLCAKAPKLPFVLKIPFRREARHLLVLRAVLEICACEAERIDYSYTSTVVNNRLR